MKTYSTIHAMPTLGKSWLYDKLKNLVDSQTILIEGDSITAFIPAWFRDQLWKDPKSTVAKQTFPLIHSLYKLLMPRADIFIGNINYQLKYDISFGYNNVERAFKLNYERSQDKTRAISKDTLKMWLDNYLRKCKTFAKECYLIDGFLGEYLDYDPSSKSLVLIKKPEVML